MDSLGRFYLYFSRDHDLRFGEDLIKMTVTPPVELFQIPFPRLSRQQSVDKVKKAIANQAALSVCFPDISMINQLYENEELKQMVKKHFLPLNDGAGLAFSAFLQGKRFPDNLNGTDWTPELLRQLPSKTKVFLVGGTTAVATKTLHDFQQIFPHIEFLGSHHGFLKPIEEQTLVDHLRTLKPNLVLVGMGNPLQLSFIHKYRSDPSFENTTWIAVGGLFDFYGGARIRAPKWMRKLRLEWLHIIWVQPQKIPRYLTGIPKFLYRTFLLFLLKKHKSLS